MEDNQKQQMKNDEMSAIKKLEEMEKQTNTKKKKEKRTSDYYVHILKFYYLPVFIVMIFLLVAVFAVLPSLKSLLSNYSELNNLKNEVKDKDAKIEQLKALKNRSTQTEAYLASINKIAPVQKTNVTEFQNSIKNTAKSNRLSIQSARGGEEIVSDQQNTGSFQLVEIPMYFVFSGNFLDLKNFLNDLYQGEDFIIIEKMDLSKADKSTEWKMDLTLVKYQFIQKDSDTSIVLNVNDLSTDLVPSEQVLQFLQEKYIDTTDTTDTNTTNTDNTIIE